MINLYDSNKANRASMVKELARYLTMRNAFRDGVYYHDFQDARTMKDADVFFKGTIA